MSKTPARNLLKSVDLNAVLANALTPGQVPAASAFRGGQSVAMPDGSKFMVIGTELCAEPDTWDRPETISESVEKLKASLKEVAETQGTEFGNYEPVIVQGTAPGYEILSGKCRWLAARELKLKILVRAMPKVRVGLERVCFEVMANGHRTNLSPVEIIKAAKVLEGAGASTAQIAAALGKSERSVLSYLKVGKDPVLLEQISNGLITYKDATAKGAFSFHKVVEVDAGGEPVAPVFGGAASGSTKGVDLGPLRFIDFDEKKKIMSLSIRMRDASKADKRTALRKLQSMVERLNTELNSNDPRKADRRKREAVTPSKLRKVDKD